jgi:hypothetical protein
MALAFAKETEVEPETTRAEIEKILKKVGCTKFAFMVDEHAAQIAFQHGKFTYRFAVRVPTESDVLNYPSGGPRSYRHIPSARAQLERTRWRTLLLGIRARMAEVECGILTFAEAFFPATVLRTGQTVFEAMAPELERLEPGPLLKLLAAPER